MNSKNHPRVQPAAPLQTTKFFAAVGSLALLVLTACGGGTAQKKAAAET
jgi:hypothetical protein